MKPEVRRWLRGLLGGAVGVVVGFAVSFPLFFVIGPSTIFNEDIQSHKVLSAWEDEPLPLYATNLGIVLVGYAIIGALLGLVFVGIVGSLPSPTVRRGIAYGLVVFAVAFVFAEFAFPFALLLEPLPLVALELAIQFPAAIIAGLVISAIYGKG